MPDLIEMPKSDPSYHTVSVVFGPNATLWAFLFKDRTVAALALQKIRSTGEIEDDFGQSASLVTSSIHGATLESIDQQADAMNERQIAMARGQAKLDELMQRDPEVRRAIQRARMQQMQQRMVAPGPMPQ
jgi:hypothetical protein